MNVFYVSFRVEYRVSVGGSSSPELAGAILRSSSDQPRMPQKNRALGFPPREDGPFDPKNCRIPAPPFLELIKREALFGGRKNCQKGPKTDLPLKFAFSGAPENPSRLICSKKAGGWSDPHPAVLQNRLVLATAVGVHPRPKRTVQLGSPGPPVFTPLLIENFALRGIFR